MVKLRFIEIKVFSIQGLIIISSVFLSCAEGSKKKVYNPDKINLKKIDSLQYLLFKEVDEKNTLVKTDSATLIDETKNQVVGHYISRYYINKKSSQLAWAFKDNYYDQYCVSYLVRFVKDTPLSGERSVWTYKKGFINSRYAEFYFYNDKLYQKKKDSIILINDQIKSEASKILVNFSKLQ